VADLDEVVDLDAGADAVSRWWRGRWWSWPELRLDLRDSRAGLDDLVPGTVLLLGEPKPSAPMMVVLEGDVVA